jgi:predicted Fe-S protein YdhL (DUF1289 family)
MNLADIKDAIANWDKLHPAEQRAVIEALKEAPDG